MRRLALSLATLALVGCGSARAAFIPAPTTTTVPPTTTTVVSQSENGVTLVGTAKCDVKSWIVTWQASSAHPDSSVAWSATESDAGRVAAQVVAGWDQNMTATFRYAAGVGFAYETVQVRWMDPGNKWPSSGGADARVTEPRCIVP